MPIGVKLGGIVGTCPPPNNCGKFTPVLMLTSFGIAIFLNFVWRLLILSPNIEYYSSHSGPRLVIYMRFGHIVHNIEYSNSCQEIVHAFPTVVHLDLFDENHGSINFRLIKINFRALAGRPSQPSVPFWFDIENSASHFMR